MAWMIDLADSFHGSINFIELSPWSCWNFNSERLFLWILGGIPGEPKVGEYFQQIGEQSPLGTGNFPREYLGNSCVLQNEVIPGQISGPLFLRICN